MSHQTEEFTGGKLMDRMSIGKTQTKEKTDGSKHSSNGIVLADNPEQFKKSSESEVCHSMEENISRINIPKVEKMDPQIIPDVLMNDSFPMEYSQVRPLDRNEETFPI